MTDSFDFMEELNKHKGFTLTSSNGVLWVTKLRNKSMTLCYKPKDDNVFYPIGLIKDVKAFEEFFKGVNEMTTNYEKIKSLDIGSMICFIRNLTNDEYTCSFCKDKECDQEFIDRDYDRCDKGIRQWLESEG